MAELIDEINEIIGEDVEQMVIGGEDAPERNEHAQPGGQNVEDPVEEIQNPPRAPSPAQAFIIHVDEPPAARGPAVAPDLRNNVGAVGGPRRQPQHGRRGGGGGRGRGACGRHGYHLYRGTRAGRQVQRRREAAQFVEWLGLLQKQAYNNRH